MTSAITPNQQVQMIPVFDLSQQSQGQYYALELPQQPQDQYIPNNQILIGNNLPGGISQEERARSRKRLAERPLLSGAVTGGLVYSGLNFLNFMSEGLLGSKKAPKFNNNTIRGITAFAAIASTTLQWIKGLKSEHAAKKQEALMRRGF